MNLEGNQGPILPSFLSFLIGYKFRISNQNVLKTSTDVSNYTLGILQTYHWVYYRRICTIIKKVLFVKGLKALLILRVS